MKFVIGLLLALVFSAGAACAQQTNFQHIVVIVQENRSPDSLFYTLCATQQCSTKPGTNTYDIQTSDWLDKNAKGGVVQPGAMSLASEFGPTHSHEAFVAMCDLNGKTNTCRMDGADNIRCHDCPPNAEFNYVDNSQHVVDPYLFLATQYGWANYMFQTNQGPSFPAHQFIFGATSAPSGRDDHRGVFISENLKDPGIKDASQIMNGCLAGPNARIQLINGKGQERPKAQIYPCVDHRTLGDVLDQKSVTWRYYTPGPGDLWSAPDAIKHICEPSAGKCTGPIWQQNVALNPVSVLSDISSCNLRNVSWVIPSAQFSDHAVTDTVMGPSWVAAVVNAVGNSKCTNTDGSSYWNSTAIVITWDDWGGWYDHEPPTILPYPQGGYQYGFRVPLLFVSAYTPPGYINNERQDFGSIARFIESNFGIKMGALTFADARATLNLSSFYNLTNTARSFQTVPAPPLPVGLSAFKMEPPDDD